MQKNDFANDADENNAQTLLKNWLNDHQTETNNHLSKTEQAKQNLDFAWLQSVP
jgi:hypothetical protein